MCPQPFLNLELRKEETFFETCPKCLPALYMRHYKSFQVVIPSRNRNQKGSNFFCNVVACYISDMLSFFVKSTLLKYKKTLDRKLREKSFLLSFVHLSLLSLGEQVLPVMTKQKKCAKYIGQLLQNFFCRGVPLSSLMARL